MLLFQISLFVTFIVTRIIVYSAHDKNNYNSKTLTGHIRRITKFDFHHIHFGILLLFLILFFYYFFP